MRQQPGSSTVRNRKVPKVKQGKKGWFVVARGPTAVKSEAPTGIETNNYFADLCEGDPTPVVCSVPGKSVQKSKKGSRRNAKKQSKVATVDKKQDDSIVVCPEVDRPHQASLYLPVKIDRVASVFLIDRGCTTNILSKRIFDRLPAAVKQGLQVNEADAGLLVEGSALKLLGTIKLRVRVRAHLSEEVFWVSKIREDGILGMPFLTTRRCAIDFSSQKLSIDDYEAQCTDRFGKPLSASLQLVR